VGLVVPIVRRRWGGGATAVPAPAPDAPARGWRLDAATTFNLCLVMLFAAALWESRRFDTRAGLFPWTITTAALLLAIVNVVRELTAPRRGPTADDRAADATPSREKRRRTVAICGWILGMYAAIWLLGFSLATLLTTFLYLRGARERWPISVGLSLAGFAFVYGLFEMGLGVPFPAGRLLVWLGYAS
jgi:hypothetical protein